MPIDFQIAVDSSQPHVLAGWWAETLGWVVEPSDEAFIRKMVAEGYATDDDTMTHNGMHLDLRVGEENVDSQVAKLTERGATYLHKASQGPHWWVTMADPEGNEFCVT